MENLLSYPEVKFSGIPWLGNIPERWSVAPGFSAFREKYQKNIGMIEKNVLSLSYGKLVIKPPEKLHGLVPGSFETYQIVNPDDIIIRPTDLQNDWNSLRVGIARNRGIITSAYLCLKTISPLISSYGYLLLHAYDLMKIFYGMGSGLRQNLSYADLKRMPILIPSQEEQVLISRFLGNHEKITQRYIKLKKSQIKLLEEQKQFIIQSAVINGLNSDVKRRPSDIEWVGEIPEHWKVIPNRRLFRENVRMKRDGTELRFSLSQRDGLISTSEMKERSLLAATHENFKVCLPGDLILNRFKAHLGVFFAAWARGIVTYHYGVYEPLVEMRTKYFEYLFHTMPYRTIYAGASNGMTVGLQNLSNQNFYKIKSIVPPLDEQDQILAYIEEHTATINAAQKVIQEQINAIKEYHSRLISDVVTGKLDVREAAKNLPETEALEIAEQEPMEDDELSDELEESEEMSNADE